MVRRKDKILRTINKWYIVPKEILTKLLPGSSTVTRRHLYALEKNGEVRGFLMLHRGRWKAFFTTSEVIKEIKRITKRKNLSEKEVIQLLVNSYQASDEIVDAEEICKKWREIKRSKLSIAKWK